MLERKVVDRQQSSVRPLPDSISAELPVYSRVTNAVQDKVFNEECKKAISKTIKANEDKIKVLNGLLEKLDFSKDIKGARLLVGAILDKERIKNDQLRHHLLAKQVNNLSVMKWFVISEHPNDQSRNSWHKESVTTILDSQNAEIIHQFFSSEAIQAEEEKSILTGYLLENENKRKTLNLIFLQAVKMYYLFC